MDKKEKQLQKALKLAGIDADKFNQVIDLLTDDEEETPKKEVEKEAVKEEPKEEVKEQPKEVKEQPKNDELSELKELLKAIGETVQGLDEKTKNLEQTVTKNKSFGYNPAPKEDKAEVTPDSIAEKMQKMRF